ncbi:TPA: hypothetical protein ACH3X1_005799 [Trebouxia sp. C0004]
MARSLKTPDSGLGPGLYQAAPASFFHHAPQVVIGGYAPREAVSKLRSISYSRSIMAVHIPTDDEDAEGDDANSNDHQAYHAHTKEWPQWASSTRYPLKPAATLGGMQEQTQVGVYSANAVLSVLIRTQDRAQSLTRPLSGHPSHHSRLQMPSSLLAQPSKTITGVAGKSVAPVHYIPHQGSRGTWKQGCFQPPWPSMRRKPGVASAPPSDWGWVALNVDQGSFGKGAWAGDGRLEVNHQSILTPENTGPLLRSAEPAPNGMQRGPSSMQKIAAGFPSLPTTISSLQHHISSLPATRDVAETIKESACISSATLADNCGQTAAPDAACSLLCFAGSDAAGNAETSHANSQSKSGLLLSTGLDGASNPGPGQSDLQIANVPDASSKCSESKSWHSPVQHAGQRNAGAGKADEMQSQAAHVQPCSSVLQSLSLFDEAEHCRHRQATKAAKRAYMSQGQQRMWEAKSQAGNLGALPTWL